MFVLKLSGIQKSLQSEKFHSNINLNVLQDRLVVNNHLFCCNNQPIAIEEDRSFVVRKEPLAI
jgi:hypothetical protein